MAFLTGSIVTEIREALQTLQMNSTRRWDVPPGKPSGIERLKDDRYDTNDRMDRIAANARKLAARGKADLALATIEEFRTRPAPIVILGSISNMDRELDEMTQMRDRVLAGTETLNESLANGSEVEQVRYAAVSAALEKQNGWPEMLDEIRRRAGL